MFEYSIVELSSSENSLSTQARLNAMLPEGTEVSNIDRRSAERAEQAGLSLRSQRLADSLMLTCHRPC